MAMSLLPEHVPVREHGLEERPFGIHAAQQGKDLRPGAREPPLTAAPKPYQPGSIRRHCDQLNTQGMARKSSMRWEFLREAGRLPMFRLAILADDRRLLEVAGKALGLVDQLAIGAIGVGRQLAMAASQASLGASAGSSRVASSVAAARISSCAADIRLGIFRADHLALLGDADRALDGTGRLGQDRLVARPPPRPTDPPRPWKRRAPRHAVAKHVDQRQLGTVEFPGRG